MVLLFNKSAILSWWGGILLISRKFDASHNRFGGGINVYGSGQDWDWFKNNIDIFGWSMWPLDSVLRVIFRHETRKFFNILIFAYGRKCQYDFLLCAIYLNTVFFFYGHP